MPTTIQVSDEIRTTLERMKLYEKESYNDIIGRMLEDQKELNQKTKREIEDARKRVKSGKFVTMDSVAKRYGV